MMNQNLGNWVNGPSADTLEWLTEALEQRSFNSGTIKVLLELFMAQRGVCSAQVFQAAKKDNKMQLDLQHFSGDMSTEHNEQIEDALYQCFNRQSACHFSEQHGLNDIQHELNLHREPALSASSHLLLPLKVNNICIGVLLIGIRTGEAFNMPIHWLRLLSSILAQCLSCSLLPNFVTLYARPYQRVEEDEMGSIRDALRRCGGNKTMAAKVLGMTPRQLRYRLEKLSELQ